MLGRVARRRPRRIYARSAQSIVARARSPTSATISAMIGPANHGRDLTSETVGRADEHFDGDRSIPIVMNDAVQAGLGGRARPGSNRTGVTLILDTRAGNELQSLETRRAARAVLDG